MHSLRDRLKNGEFVFGTWCLIPSPYTIDVLAKAGLDFVLIDMEHGPMDFTLSQNMIMAAEANGCEAIVRVGKNDEYDILRALDMRPSGIIVPHIEGVKQREQAISYIKYPPKGCRGYSPYTRSGGYSPSQDYTNNENKRILSGIIIEGNEGIKNIEKIIDDTELDIVYVGTYDISCSLGIPGDVNNKKVIHLLETCVKSILDSGKIAGGLFRSSDELNYFKKIGVQLLAYKVDSSVLYDGFSILNNWREGNLK